MPLLTCNDNNTVTAITRLPECRTRPADRCPRWRTVGAKTTVSYPISCPTTLENS